MSCQRGTMLKLKGIIPAVSDAGTFEKFLRSNYEVCFLMNMHVSLISSLIRKGHAAGKKLIVHLDMVSGLSDDEPGCEYLCQVLKADGVISTRGKVVLTAKKNRCTAVLRLFLIDSRSLEKGIVLANELKPNYLEILPAIATDIIPEIQKKTATALIGGGLLSSEEQIVRALNEGLEAVSCSKPLLWH
ncbi:MAG: glycerol-3-phosphate responsive antiterminator [Erysipelotrichia bacterium]|nr:glycerol-3-phosphate responsive antiterminator [Erysipelotrichia bacterium]